MELHVTGAAGPGLPVAPGVPPPTATDGPWNDMLTISSLYVLLLDVPGQLEVARLLGAFDPALRDGIILEHVHDCCSAFHRVSWGGFCILRAAVQPLQPGVYVCCETSLLLM